jgi:penicillin-binding protein 1B
MGTVTLRNALAHSLNVATVQVAQKIGYDRVVKMARRVGLNDDIQPTPAVALGAYDTTPLEIAGAYTTFANEGVRVTPTTISLVRAPDGSILYQHEPDGRATLDPRVNYLMVSMMQDVLRYGTGAGVRGRGFNLPAAGKTGTSHDGWFAGYTSNLLCIVWVGFDDYSDLRLSGAQTAAPIWADFMKKAIKLPQYSDMKPFTQPSGVVDVQLDKSTNRLATPACPETYTAAFVAGTEPHDTCDQANGVKGFFSRIFGLGGDKPLPPAPAQPGTPAADQSNSPEKKKGFFGKIAGIFKDDKSSKSSNQPSSSTDGQTH